MDHQQPHEPAVGEAIAELRLPALTRLTLALYCGASGDHNPVHVDIDYANNVAGLDDVIGHGMLTMAYMGRLLTMHFPQEKIRSFFTRFVAPIYIGDCITCSGQVVEKSTTPEKWIKLELQASRADGQCLATGEAVVDL